MTKIRAAITGVHGYVPDYVLTNKELSLVVVHADQPDTCFSRFDQVMN
jgi:3-oxoacyl-[acyl-carrier-protein] synthase-3